MRRWAAWGRGLQPIADRLDDVGLIEHARGPVPEPAFGHCTDDAGRALGLAAAMPDDPLAELVAAACLAQLERSLAPDGRFVLRLDAGGRPTADPPSDDADARAVWGLAVATTAALAPASRRAAATLLDAVAPVCVSPHPRAAAHAVLAGVHLAEHGHDPAAGALIEANRAAVPPPWPGGDGAWRWPEPRLSYGNGLVAEAMLALASHDRDLRARGAALEVLTWLVTHERRSDGTFSFTPVGGAGPGDPHGFDQQPIEAWALASAAARACSVTGDRTWADVCARLVDWFDGDNDAGVPMWDHATGAAYDGLTEHGVNANQGTESSLALIGTVSAAARCGASPGTTLRAERRPT